MLASISKFDNKDIESFDLFQMRMIPLAAETIKLGQRRSELDCLLVEVADWWKAFQNGSSTFFALKSTKTWRKINTVSWYDRTTERKKDCKIFWVADYVFVFIVVDK